MREVVGFMAGVAVTVATASVAGSESGRRLIRELKEQAAPEVAGATDDWEPLLREVARAVRLGAAEVARVAGAIDGQLQRLADEAAARRSEAVTTDAQAVTTDAQAVTTDAQAVTTDAQAVTTDAQADGPSTEPER